MQQHWLPKVYLEGFTDPDCPANYAPYVHVHRYGAADWERRAPINLAKSPDYYTLSDGAGNESLLFEGLLGKVESKFAAVLRGLIAQRVVPVGDDRGVIAEFVALMMVRLPAQHERMAKLHERMTRMGLQLQHQIYREHPAQWEVRKAEMRREGLEVPDDLTPEDVYAPKGIKLAVEVPKESVLVPAFEMVPELAEMIFRMSWILYRTNDASPFITSDWPMALWNPKLPLKSFVGPGLAQREVELTLPLTRNVALFGVWGARDLGFRSATPATVRAMNMRTIKYSREFAAASKTSFPGANHVVRRLRQGRAARGRD